MRDIKMIAFDLDGTLLTTDKRITPRTYAALEAASRKGVAIVPSTGRYIKTIPQQIKELSCVDYIISINGAYVFNVKTKEEIYRAELPINKALDILKLLDGYDVVYDAYINNESYVNYEMKQRIHKYVGDKFYLQLVWKNRIDVDELKSFVTETGRDVQKIMTYTQDQSLKKNLMKILSDSFDDIIVTTSINDNIEINDSKANKGNAISKIAEHMGIDMSQVMAFGDGSNDISMIDAAGVGVVMANASDIVKAHADILAPSCDEEGVAYIIEKEILGE